MPFYLTNYGPGIKAVFWFKTHYCRSLSLMDAATIFDNEPSFKEKALSLFAYQAVENPLYKRYLTAINCNPVRVKTLEQIPFLPISFFKNFAIKTGEFEPEIIFTSSGTTGMQTSRHLVRDLGLYEQSFLKAFRLFYGDPAQYCVLGLLPAYLEREGSSLVYMVQQLIKQSRHPLSGFYLHDFDRLAQTLRTLGEQKVLLIGVTFALIDFAAAFPMHLPQAIVMETGGMKGRKKELLRTEVHTLLQEAFGLPQVHAEYGMTELLSQAYAQKEGYFKTPPWMKVLLREEDDPFALVSCVKKPRAGALNVIDLANVHSCAFIATDDIARLHPDGSFEILGRMDHSDIRGCSLLAV